MGSRSESKDYDVKSISSSTSITSETSLNTVVTLPIVGKDTKDELPNTGMTCDVKNLWEGKDKDCGCCVDWLEEYPEDVKPNPEETEAVQRFALLVRNRRDHGFGKGMVVSSIVVQSPLLKNMLEEVFEGYEGITTTLKKVTFTAPFEPFFYRWSQFKKAVEDVEDEATRAHAKLLYDVLSKELDETISTYQDLFSHGVMTYKHLWTLFKPGDLLLCQMKGEEMLMRLESSDYDPRMGYCLYCKYVDWDGYDFGYGSHNFIISRFDGTRAITDLDAYPIQFNSEGAEIESRLAARGRRFEQLQGYHYKMYKGIAELLPVNVGRRYLPVSNRTLDGRIIIDAEMYNRFNPGSVLLAPLSSVSFRPKIEEDESIHHKDAATEDDEVNLYAPPPPMPQMISDISDPIPSDEPIEPKILAEELYPICTPVLRGYSLKTKNWARFKIDCIHEIAWDDKAFSSLVLPPGYKDLILAFTKNQNSTEGIRADVIEGKGQGIVMLLNGEPGVGKTLTAESVAEHLRVPLYSMSAGQLGVRSEDVEQSLGDILEMATKWKAVLLLDETEVFLEQRTIDGLERNKLVSIFLRMLEYYRGVLFLTTNHISVLDKAMESRIHLKISYPQLDHAARLQVWRNLVRLLPASSVGLHESDLEFLAQKRMNGREIKNSIKAAQLLASGQESALNLEHILTVLRITQIGESMTAQV